MTERLTFDAVAYKATTREQWQQAAPAWDAWGRRARGLAR